MAKLKKDDRRASDGLRWLIRRDMDEVMEIERTSFSIPWSEEDVLCCLRQQNCIGTVLEIDRKVVGFMIYELHKDQLRILNMAVSPNCRRVGYGHQMIQRLIDKLAQQRRRSIRCEVRETNLEAQLFMRSMGFRCERVLRKHYDDTDEAAYEFWYRLGGESA